MGVLRPKCLIEQFQCLWNLDLGNNVNDHEIQVGVPAKSVAQFLYGTGC